MLEHSPDTILCDDVLEVFFGKGCSRKNDGVGNVLGKFSVHDYVGLIDFVMEGLFHRSDLKAKKGFGGINLVEVQYNME